MTGWSISWEPVPQVYGSPAGNFRVKAWLTGTGGRSITRYVWTEDEARSFDPEAEWATMIQARKVQARQRRRV